MAINVDKAFDIDENGVGLRDDNGNYIFYVTSGSGAPSGSAPVNSWYFRQDTRTIYYKFGALDTDWRQIEANDIIAYDQLMNPQTIQYLLDQVSGGGGSGVSQTAIFGNGGNTSQNSYLPNEGVPSNIVGVPVGLTNPTLRSIYLGNENSKTGDVYIQQRFPAQTGTWTTIYTLNLNNQSYKNEKGLSVILTTDAELAVFTTVSLKNAKIVLNTNGDSAV